MHQSENHFILSSVCDVDMFPNGWVEVCAAGIYCIKIGDCFNENDIDINDGEKIPNSSTPADFCYKNITLHPWIQGLDFQHPNVITDIDIHGLEIYPTGLPNSFPTAVKSYGLVPYFKFFNEDIPSTGIKELLTKYDGDVTDLSSIALDEHLELSEILINKLSESVKKRVQNKADQDFLIEKELLPPFEESLSRTESGIGILYSGGIDSHILAALADKYFCIYLIDIKFYNVFLYKFSPRKQFTKFWVKCFWCSYTH